MRPPAPYVDIAQIQDSDEWVSLKVKVLSIYPVPRHDSMLQQGVLIDRYGDSIEYIVWLKNNEKARYAPLEAGKSYNLENVVTNEYRGQFSINVPWSARVAECKPFKIEGEGEEPNPTTFERFGGS